MNNSLLWYTTRAAGVVSMVLLSSVMALGLLTRARAGAAAGRASSPRRSTATSP